jgi:hypothetical protein
VHDAKMSNLLLDARTLEALCVVDLDTVMPGLAVHDFGDMARTMAAAVPEDTHTPERSVVRADMFDAIVRGYLEGTAGLLGVDEVGGLVSAVQAIVFEQGVRFLTDYLDGDRYYRVSDAEQNLRRTRGQLALLESFVREERMLLDAVRAAAASRRR